MKTKKQLSVLLPVLFLCLLFPVACSENGNDAGTPAATAASGAEVSAAADASAEGAALESRMDTNGTDAPNETRIPPDIQSDELTGFMLAFGDPEGNYAIPNNDNTENTINSASFTLTLKTKDPLDYDSPVTCTIAAKPYDAPEDAEAQHVTFAANVSDLKELQTLIEKTHVIETSCNYDDGVDADTDYEFIRLTILYASGESAYHYCNTSCEFNISTIRSFFGFFYGLLDKYDQTFYHHATGYGDEEAFIEAFLGQAPWDELSVTDKDGNTVTLALASDPTGRVFRLEAGEDFYAGNYKLKKKEEDGRWRLDLTLTQWPASYVPMTKGGSILIDTEVASGAETLVVSKYPNAASLFDPFYGNESDLVFTRNRTEFFEDKPFATKSANEGASE